jgi:hypothetical protein
VIASNRELTTTPPSPGNSTRSHAVRR